MIFESTQVKGKGRGRKIGVPTINLRIPPDFSLEEGIYAAWLHVDSQKYKGALHFGPVPVFNDIARSLEVYLLDVEPSSLPSFEGKTISVEIVKKIREIRNFKTPVAMVEQIQKDVEEIQASLR